MRVMIGALLLASVAAVPAMAQDRPHDGQHQNGGNHGGDHGGRGDGGNRGGGPQGGAAPQARPQGQAPRPDFQRPQGSPGGNSGGGFQPHGGAPGGPDGGHRIEGRPDNGVQVWRNDRGGAPRPDWSNRPGDRAPGNGDRNHDGRPDVAARHLPYGWDNNRAGWNGNGNRSDNRGGWNNGWRNDSRYDWRGWRDTHRDAYRIGRYRPPYGYGGGYRRWGIGVRIDPIFFGQDYWIGDPGYYRLPPAYGNYRWVRYYNDALLIDIYSGIVVDEIPDFFW